MALQRTCAPPVRSESWETSDANCALNRFARRTTLSLIVRRVRIIMTSRDFTAVRRLFGVAFLVRSLWYGFLAYLTYFHALLGSYAIALFETFSNLVFAIYFLFAAFALLRQRPIAPALHFSIAFSLIFFERIVAFEPVLIIVWVFGVSILSILIYRCVHGFIQPDTLHA